MKGLCLFKRFNTATLFVGLFVLVLMAGCVHVETTCTSCCGKDGPRGDGACNPVPAGGDYLGSANGFWITTSTQYEGTGNCVAGSKKCGIPAGRCATGALCKSWVNPNTMVCKCDCNP